MIKQIIVLFISLILYTNAYIVFSERADDLKHIRNKRDLNIQFIQMHRYNRTFYIQKDGPNIKTTLSPQMNYYLPDSHPTTNYSNYLLGVNINKPQRSHFSVQNQTFIREYKFNDFLRVQNELKVDIIQRTSFYALADFYEDGEISHKEYSNEKFLQFLRNTIHLQETPLSIIVVVLENEETKELFLRDIRRSNYMNNQQGIIEEIFEKDKQELPLYISAITVQEYNQNVAEVAQIYGSDFLNKFTNWSEESALNKTKGTTAAHDIQFLEQYQQFVKNINWLVENKVQNGNNLMKSQKTMAELLGSQEYTIFKEHWFNFQETLFMSQMLFSQLQYYSAIKMLKKSQDIFEKHLIKILSTNRAGSSDNELWVILDFVKQYTFTLIALFCLFAYVIYFIRTAPEISYFNKKVI